ncbi:MAG TPA: hypothetical protein PLG09_09470 [Syntrophomonadaceae bacterium]|jgi:hypothetical protein|nr:hypothetical protein [Syntrophomonadaceae bacterium]HOQ10338.1 hypothetical protein [Syntrophomonadaceae bacterium]HPU49800.1 hypothetical protein [Syntrophomonadaceae bacterium]
MQISRFEHVNGIPVEEKVEEWVETYFHNMMTVLNSFLSYVDIAVAVDRLKSIPFDKLVREELEGESEAVLTIAVNKIQELAEAEISFQESYLNP